MAQNSDKSDKFLMNKMRSDDTNNREENETNEKFILMSFPFENWYSCLIVLAGFLLHFFLDGLTFSFGQILNDISKEMKSSKANVALVGSCMSILYYVGGPFASALINQFGFRITGSIGIMMSSVFLFLASFSKNLITMGICLGICGIGNGMIGCASGICIGFNFDKYRSVANGIAGSGSGIGIFVIFPLINLILFKWRNEENYWRLFMVIESILMAFCLVFVMFLKKPKPVKVLIEEKKTTAATPTLRSPSSDSDSDIDDVSVVITNFDQRASMDVVSITPKSRRSSFRMARPSFVGNHPFLTVAESLEQDDDSIFHVAAVKRSSTSTRPMYRDDILHSSSLKQLSQMVFPTSTSTLSPIDTHLLITRAPPVEKPKVPVCQHCSAHILNALKILFDFSLFQSKSFLLLAFSNFLYAFGIYIPIMFMMDRAQLYQLKKYQSQWLISTIGLANTIGRICIGILSCFMFKRPIKTISVSMVLNGIATIVTALRPDDQFEFQLIYCVLHGLFHATTITLRSTMHIQTFGLERLTNIYGLLSLSMGFGVLSGMSLLGKLKDLTGNYVATFIAAGLFQLSAGALLFFLTFVQKWEQAKFKRENTSTVK